MLAPGHPTSAPTPMHWALFHPFHFALFNAAPFHAATYHSTFSLPKPYPSRPSACCTTSSKLGEGIGEGNGVGLIIPSSMTFPLRAAFSSSPTEARRGRRLARGEPAVVWDARREPALPLGLELELDVEWEWGLALESEFRLEAGMGLVERERGASGECGDDATRSISEEAARPTTGGI